MEFADFVHDVHATVERTLPAKRSDEGDRRATWSTDARSAIVTLAPPRNVSVELDASAGPDATRWYPIDAALVPVVAQRITTHLAP